MTVYRASASTVDELAVAKSKVRCIANSCPGRIHRREKPAAAVRDGKRGSLLPHAMDYRFHRRGVGDKGCDRRMITPPSLSMHSPSLFFRVRLNVCGPIVPGDVLGVADNVIGGLRVSAFEGIRVCTNAGAASSWPIARISSSARLVASSRAQETATASVLSVRLMTSAIWRSAKVRSGVFAAIVHLSASNLKSSPPALAHCSVEFFTFLKHPAIPRGAQSALWRMGKAA